MSSKEFQDRVLDGVDAAAGNIKCNTYLSCESRQNPRADGRGTHLGDHGMMSRFKHKTDTLYLTLYQAGQPGQHFFSWYPGTYRFLVEYTQEFST